MKYKILVEQKNFVNNIIAAGTGVTFFKMCEILLVLLA